MSYKEIIFIDYSNNPSPILQRFAILSCSILNKNHKNCRVIGRSVAAHMGYKGKPKRCKPP